MSSESGISDPVEIALRRLFTSPEPERELQSAETNEHNEKQTELHQAIITYATQSARLYFTDLTKTWDGFHTANATNAEKFENLTPEDLCTEFVKRVLPRVFTFNLTETERRMFEFLQLHPGFERTEDGFKRLTTNQCRALEADVDYYASEGAEGPMEAQSLFVPDTSTLAEKFSLNTGLAPPHTIILRHPYNHQRSGNNFQFSKENAALISATLSNDLELSNCALLQPSQMKERLIVAKQNFAQYAEMRINCVDAEQLTEKLKRYKQMKAAFADITSKVNL